VACSATAIGEGAAAGPGRGRRRLLRLCGVERQRQPQAEPAGAAIEGLLALGVAHPQHRAAFLLAQRDDESASGSSPWGTTIPRSV
jgi:hypothetical protein